MGLIQRSIEARRVPTVSVCVARDVTEAIKVPRAIFLPWPMGHHFGVPFHRDIQRRVLFEALKLLETTTESGTIRDILIRWAEVRREAKTLTDQAVICSWTRIDSDATFQPPPPPRRAPDLPTR